QKIMTIALLTIPIALMLAKHSLHYSTSTISVQMRDNSSSHAISFALVVLSHASMVEPSHSKSFSKWQVGSSIFMGKANTSACYGANNTSISWTAMRRHFHYAKS